MSRKRNVATRSMHIHKKHHPNKNNETSVANITRKNGWVSNEHATMMKRVQNSPVLCKKHTPIKKTHTHRKKETILIVRNLLKTILFFKRKIIASKFWLENGHMPRNCHIFVVYPLYGCIPEVQLNHQVTTTRKPPCNLKHSLF